MDVYVDTLCLLAQPKEGHQQIFKKANNQNYQKIELYGSLTTKDLKKKHIQISRRGTDGQTRQRGCMAREQQEDWAGKVLAVGPTLVCG